MSTVPMSDIYRQWVPLHIALAERMQAETDGRGYGGSTEGFHHINQIELLCDAIFEERHTLPRPEVHDNDTGG